MISLAILIRAYLVIGLIYGGAQYAAIRADNREDGLPLTANGRDLRRVFIFAMFWLPMFLLGALTVIWKEIRHG